jgi:hypothetical protein
MEIRDPKARAKKGVPTFHKASWTLCNIIIVINSFNSYDTQHVQCLISAGFHCKCVFFKEKADQWALQKNETPKSTCITVFEKAHPLVTLCNTSSRNTRGNKRTLPSMDTTTSTISHPTYYYYYTKANRSSIKRPNLQPERHRCQNQPSMECLPGRICHIQTHSLSSTYIDKVSWGRRWRGGEGKAREVKRNQFQRHFPNWGMGFFLTEARGRLIH